MDIFEIILTVVVTKVLPGLFILLVKRIGGVQNAGAVGMEEGRI